MYLSNKAKGAIAAAVIVLIMIMSGCTSMADYTSVQSFSLEDIPESSSSGYVFINDNVPEFTEDEYTTDAFEAYSPLDYLGRCGPAYACLGRELMPTEDRESISHIHPTGWQSVQYDIVEGGSLYNRCHLIAFMLSGENDTEENLITGTRYMNATVMLPFEDMVADYIKNTGNHVLYRVTPVFEGTNLVASGIQMEAMSMEDYGADISFNVYIYNVQPGIEIDYATGDNWLSGKAESTDLSAKDVNDKSSEESYVLNVNSKKFHEPDCGSVDDMAEYNKGYFEGSRDSLIKQGYTPCGNCKP